MTIPDTVEQILQILEAYAGHALRERGLLAVILRHAAETGRMRELGELAFHAKYISNLLESIKKQAVHSEHTDHLGKELSAGLEQFYAMLAAFVADVQAGDKRIFEQDILVMSESALQRVVGVATDLAHLKNLERDFAELDISNKQHVADQENS